MEQFAFWLETTPLSRIIQEVTWIIPWLQIIHITALALVFGAILMLMARLLRLVGTGEAVSATLRRLLPWVWAGTAVLALSGGLLVIGEPVRSLLNEFFWAKMVVLVIALAGTLHLYRRDAAAPGYWEGGGVSAAYVRSLAVASLAGWTLIIVFGRFIAYRDNFLYF